MNLVQADVRHPVVLQESRGVSRGVESETQVVQQAGGGQEASLVAQGADRHKDLPALGQPEPGRKNRFQERLRQILAQAGHLPGGRHLDTQGRIGPLDAREGELRRLHPHMVQVEERRRHRSHLRPHQGPRRKLHEIDACDLGDEREGARGAQVALDDHDLVVNRQELHVEGSGDTESPRQLGGNRADAPNRLEIDFLWRPSVRRTTAGCRRVRRAR